MASLSTTKILLLKFSSAVPLRRVEKTLEAFCGWINNDENGHAVEIFSVTTVPQGRAILSVWYPTERESEAPVTVAEVRRSLEDYIGGLTDRHFYAPIITEVDSPPLPLWDNMAWQYNHAMQMRELYLLRNSISDPQGATSSPVAG